MHLVKRVEDSPSLPFEIGGDALAAGAFAEILAAAVLAGEEAVGEPVKGNDPEPVGQRRIAKRAFQLLSLDEASR